jgi:hypothetical protein
MTALHGIVNPPVLCTIVDGAAGLVVSLNHHGFAIRAIVKPHGALVQYAHILILRAPRLSAPMPKPL